MTKTSTTAVVFADGSHPEGTPLERSLLDGHWPLRQTKAQAVTNYLSPVRVLLAVAYRRTAMGTRRLEVIDARRVTSWQLAARANRVDFGTVFDPTLQMLVGTASPVSWPQGDAWPMKILALRLPKPRTVAPGLKAA